MALQLPFQYPRFTRQPPQSGRDTMEMETLKDLYVEELKDLYSAENQIIKALPKMIKAASHDELKDAFSRHLKETEVHVQRITQVCDDLGVSPKGKKCVGMEEIGRASCREGG